MTPLSPADFESKEFEFTEDISLFALYSNGHVVLILDDVAMTDSGLNKLLHLVAPSAEVVKVYATNVCKSTKVLSGISYGNPTGKIDTALANRMKKIPLNPPFEVKLAASIKPVTNFQVRKSIFVAPNGQVIPHMDRIKSTQKRLVASVLGATEYVVDLDVVQTIIPQASQYRSVPTS